MKGKEWLIVIVVVIIVAVLASLITSNLAGNVVRVPTSIATTQTDIYTKGEIDTKLGNITAASCDKDSICEISKTVSTRAGSGGLYLTSNLKQVFVDGSLIITPLTGINNSNAYACLTSSGQLYRSATACK